jgi:polyhydroxyalkanoate synthase
VGSDDTEALEFNLGHIGLYVSSKAQKELAPSIVEWLSGRDGATSKAGGSSKRKSSTRSRTRSRKKKK